MCNLANQNVGSVMKVMMGLHAVCADPTQMGLHPPLTFHQPARKEELEKRLGPWGLSADDCDVQYTASSTASTYDPVAEVALAMGPHSSGGGSGGSDGGVGVFAKLEAHRKTFEVHVAPRLVKANAPP